MSEEFLRGQITDLAVGPVFVVVDPLYFDLGSGIVDGDEPVWVQLLGSEVPLKLSM